MNKLKQILTDDTRKVLFVGIGNALKSDDGIGIYICRKIKQHKNISTLIVESGIEKFVGKINNINPDILVLVDCTDLQKEQGAWDIVSLNKVIDFTMNTHTISIKRISEFFLMEKYLLGIQPQNVKFGEEFSAEVQQTADIIIDLINNY